ncbi:elongation factor 4 [Candidatus Falkowbacteria bacterium]|nr:elongation factor 4 [Candidatus Falkowbacteria bacterium]
MQNIRNFCIIAHIDHGKSTLADRFLELTDTVSKREMTDRVMDTMELEKERGITIKLQPAKMTWKGYQLNLIDTPGHVDFNYEVSRSLAAVEGAVLLVDCTQGIQAQTIANLYLAIEQDLDIIPVLNKIDLPNAQIEKTKLEIVNLLGCKEEEIICVSGKTGQNVEQILDAVIEKVSPPQGDADAPLRAVIFDSFYDDYRGVVAYIRVVDGSMSKNEPLHTVATNSDLQALEVGVLRPKLDPQEKLSTGEIGYVVTGLRQVEDCRVGDTITVRNTKVVGLPGYKEAMPMVFAGIFTKDGDQHDDLREAIGKLKLNDAALQYEPEHSPALGSGFRCGFLGLLHLEIFQERLAREFNLDLVVTVPSVAYKVTLRSSGLAKDLEAKLKMKAVGDQKLELAENQIFIKSPADLPEPNFIDSIEEPMIKADIVVPSEFIGGIMGLVAEKRGIYENTEYLTPSNTGTVIDQRAVLHYKIPLSMILTDFYDKLKSVSSGYASMNYEFAGYQVADVVKMQILVAEEIVESMTMIVYRDDAHRVGKKIVETLKDNLPQQMFVVKLQAAVGGTIVASERLSAMRKDVTGYLYGGDITRKKKLLEKQKKGKKKMMEHGAGSVDIPTDVYLKVLRA